MNERKEKEQTYSEEEIIRLPIYGKDEKGGGRIARGNVDLG
jgi:hypothetical protein